DRVDEASDEDDHDDEAERVDHGFFPRRLVLPLRGRCPLLLDLVSKQVRKLAGAVDGRLRHRAIACLAGAARTGRPASVIVPIAPARRAIDTAISGCRSP